jgi:ERCC4-related helicase
VALCSQQLHELQVQIPSVQIKSLTSVDNVDRWTTKADWDTVLTNVSIVVSTYAVLYDALCHEFVSIDSIALIVFDEGKSVLILAYLPDIASQS